MVFDRKVVELSEKLYYNIKHYIYDFYEEIDYDPRCISNYEEVFCIYRIHGSVN